MFNRCPATFGALLIVCILCPACARWGILFTDPREEIPAPEEEVTAFLPGQSTERRDLILLPEG